jgi:hypothetical protein
LGKSIMEYTKSYSFDYKKAMIDESWNDYHFFDNTIEIHVNKITNIIESIECRINCFLDNVDLIGLDISDFFHFFKKYNTHYKAEKIFLQNEDQDVYDIESMGLQLWVNCLQKIVTVFISE